MLELKAEPLTPETFAPFGEVIDARASEWFSINAGRTRRYHDLDRVETHLRTGFLHPEFNQ